MPQLQLFFFGGFHVTLNGEPLTGFRSDKVRALLAYLVLEGGQPLRRDHLAELLWDGFTAETARHSLRMALSNLRQLLGNLDILSVDRQTVQFNTSSADVWCDVLHVSQLNSAIITGNFYPDDPFLNDLINNPPGEVLAGLNLDSLPFDSWRMEQNRLYQHKITRLRMQLSPEESLLPEKLEVTSPVELFERDSHLHTWRNILLSLLKTPDRNRQGLIHISGVSGVGKTRFLLEAGKIASELGFGIFSLQGTPALKWRRYGTWFEMLHPSGWVLPAPASQAGTAVTALQQMMADHKNTGLVFLVDDLSFIDSATLNWIAALILAARFPLVIAYSDTRSQTGYLEQATFHKNNLLTAHISLPPLSPAAVKSWVRASLGWYPPDGWTAWFYQESGGLPTAVQKGLDWIVQNNQLQLDHGNFSFPPDFSDFPLAEHLTEITPVLSSRLPAPRTECIGRALEAQQIKQALKTHNLITLIGPDGIGKSRLALQIAAETETLYSERAYYVSVTGMTSFEAILYTIADRLAVKLSGSEDPQHQFLRAIQKRCFLLVIDNLDIPRSISGFLDAMAHTAPDIALLVTARESLNLPAEMVCNLSGLSCPPDPVRGTPSPEHTQDCEAIQLFLLHARRVLPAFAPQKEQWESISELCRLVEGMPLSIEITGAWVETLSIDQILKNIRNDLTCLSTSHADIPPHLRSVHALFDAFWNELSGWETRILQRLSVFHGGFDGTAARLVADASPFFLRGLVNRSFLQTQVDGRFELHVLFRQYITPKLQDTPEELQAVREKHCQYYTTYLKERTDRLTNDPQARKEVQEEIENILAAWEDALQYIRIEDIEKCILGFSRFYWLKNYYQEGLRLFVRSAEQLSATDQNTLFPNPRILRARAKIRLQQALFLLAFSRLDEAIPPTQEAIEIGRTIQDTELQANAHLRMASIAWAKGDYALSRTANEDCLTIARSTGMLEYEMKGLIGLAAALKNQFEYQAAITAYQQALPLTRHFKNEYLESIILNGLGTLYEAIGELPQAMIYYAQSLQLQENSGDLSGAGASLLNMGLISDILGQYSQASQFYTRCKTIFDQLHASGNGSPFYETYLFAFMGLLHHHLGENDIALNNCLHALDQEYADNLLQARSTAFAIYGHVLTALGRLDEARAAYHQALTLNDQLHQPVFSIISQSGLARIELKTGQTALAIQHIETVLPFLDKLPLDGHVEPFRIYLSCYQVLFAANDPRAPELLTRAQAHLLDQAKKIGNTDLQKSYLENVPAHRELLALSSGRR